MPGWRRRKFEILSTTIPIMPTVGTDIRPYVRDISHRITMPLYTYLEVKFLFPDCWWSSSALIPSLSLLFTMIDDQWSTHSRGHCHSALAKLAMHSQHSRTQRGPNFSTKLFWDIIHAHISNVHAFGGNRFTGERFSVRAHLHTNSMWSLRKTNYAEYVPFWSKKIY
jgi:hypothetical protein